MLFASGLESALGWCCLGPFVLAALAVWALGSTVRDVVGWFTSDGGGIVEEAVKEMAKDVVEEVATSWLEALLRDWYG